MCLENTHNGAGGRVMPLAQLRAVAQAARERGVAVHLDGARLPNASAATGVPMADFAAPVDTVMIAALQGAGRAGGLHAGRHARTPCSARGASAGGWAAGCGRRGSWPRRGCTVCATTFPGWSRTTAARASWRRGRRGVAGLSVAAPETNIVMIDLAEPRLEPAALLAALERRGVRLTQFGARRLRAVTHLDVDDAGIARAGDALGEAVGELLG